MFKSKSYAAYIIYAGVIYGRYDLVTNNCLG